MRWLGRVLGSLLLLALLFIAALFLIPSETVARLASAQIERLTGRSLQLEGGVSPTIWPQLGVRTGPVTLANAPWSNSGPMLRAEALSLAVDMAALIGGTVRVTGIELTEPQLLLERSADGAVNWDLRPPPPERAGTGSGGPAPDPAGAAAPTPFTIDSAEIAGGTIRYLDHATGDTITLSEVALHATVPDYGGEARVTAAASANGQLVNMSASVSGFSDFLDGNVVQAVVAGSAAGAEFSFDGRLGIAPVVADGAGVLSVQDVPALSALLGAELPVLPQGLGQDRIALRGAVTLTSEGSLHLRDGTVELDMNRLTGAFDLVPGPDRPTLTAQLVTEALDLSALGSAGAGTASGSGAGGPAAAPDAWSTAPIDASGLGAADAAVSLAAERVDLGGVLLGRTRADVTVDAARAVVDLREMAAYDGAVSGQIIVNARNGFSARANLSMAGLALQPLLASLADSGRLTGTGDLRMNLLGAGNSVDALMRSLSGEATVAFRNGEVLGLDLAGMIRTLDVGYVGEGARTVFDSITASFAVEGGVATNSDLSLSAPLITASGAGRADIGARTVEYRLTPLTLGGQPLDPDVQVPVLVSGPWAAPRVRLDIESLAERRFEEEKKQLEDRARAEIEQKVLEETGIEAQPGESLEDTARRAAEKILQDEAARALERLLGGGSGD